MFNNFIKKHRKVLFILIVPYIIIILCGCIKINYDFTAPADVENVGEVIEIIGCEDLNIDINTVSVYSFSRISLLDYLIASINKKVTVEKTYEYYNTDNTAVITGGEIQKKVSINNSIITAFEQAGKEIAYTNADQNGYIIHTLATYAPSEFKLGDQILAINEKHLSTSNTINKVIREEINVSFDKYDEKVYIDDDNLLAKYKMTFLIKRASKEIELQLTPNAYYKVYDTFGKEDVYPLFGISTYPYNIITSTNPKVNLYEASTIGPSGGLMQALYLYELLDGGKLTKNLKIVGTGTVDAYGNAGPIGGIYQKVQAAAAVKADIFFVPVNSMKYDEYIKEDNYQEAFKSYQKLTNKKMKLIPVASLKDIIDYLTIYQGGE